MSFFDHGVFDILITHMTINIDINISHDTIT